MPAIQPRQTNRCSRKRAFTIIELLVVVSLIALLVALLVPNLIRAREVTRRVTCGSNMRQLMIAWLAYPRDHNGWLVFGHPTGKGTTMFGYPVGQWAFVEPGVGLDKIQKGALYQYTGGSVDIWQCPSELAGKRTIESAAGWTARSDRSYSIVGSMFGEGWGGPHHVNFAYRKYDIVKPSSQVVWMEENDYRDAGTAGWNIGSWLLNDNWGWIDYVARFHDGVDNVALADGTVIWYEWKDPRVIEQSVTQYFGQSTPNSEDWIFMSKLYWGGLANPTKPSVP